MFAYKKKYFLIIRNIEDINLNNIKKSNKFVIIFRNQKPRETINSLIKFRKNCKIKGIEFYIANNFELAILLNFIFKIDELGKLKILLKGVSLELSSSPFDKYFFK